MANRLRLNGNELAKINEYAGALAHYDSAIALLVALATRTAEEEVLLTKCRCNRCMALAKLKIFDELHTEASAVIAANAVDHKGLYYRCLANIERANIAAASGGAAPFLKEARVDIITASAVVPAPKGFTQLRAKWGVATSAEKKRAASARAKHFSFKLGTEGLGDDSSSSSYDSPSSDDDAGGTLGGARVASQLSHYRAGYPGDPDALLNDPAATQNLEFFRGEGPQLPDGFTIDMFHPGGKYWGNYAALEKMHSYIQWLFPIMEFSRFNKHAQVLQRHEAATMRTDPACRRAFILSYRCFLDFIGLVLDDEATGALSTHAEEAQWRERFANLNTHGHNNLRLCRILKCMGEIGFEAYKAPLIDALVAAAFDEPCTLKNLRESIEAYYVGTLRDDAARGAREERVASATAYAADPVFALAAAGEGAVVLDNSPNDAGVGVNVFWHSDDKWYPGQVTKYNAFQGRHTVRYSDGDVREHDFEAMDAQCFRVLRTVPRGEADAALAANGDVRRPATPTASPPSVLMELALTSAEPETRFKRWRALPAIVDPAAAATRWSIDVPQRVVERVARPFPPLTQVKVLFDRMFFKGVVVSYSEKADTCVPQWRRRIAAPRVLPRRACACARCSALATCTLPDCTCTLPPERTTHFRPARMSLNPGTAVRLCISTGTRTYGTIRHVIFNVFFNCQLSTVNVKIESYNVIFNDGDNFPECDEDEVYQDMSAPLQGEAIAVDAKGSEDAFVGSFVARRLDGAWIIARGGDDVFGVGQIVTSSDDADDAGTVATIPATENERASALPLPKRIPKVLLEDIPSWADAAPSILFGGETLLARPQLIVTVSSTKRRFKKLVTTVKVRQVPPRSLALSLSRSLGLSHFRTFALSHFRTFALSLPAATKRACLPACVLTTPFFSFPKRLFGQCLHLPSSSITSTSAA